MQSPDAAAHLRGPAAHELDDQHALRLHALRQGGAEAMLRTYGPSMRWRAPVLEVVYPVDRDLCLDGRGPLLVPSHFARSPVDLADTALPPTLVRPARPRTADDTPPTHKGLALLLGHTRAGVLQALGGDPTTTELARRAGGSLSSASEHAAVLRGAGLVSRVRQSNAVRHALTPLGSALLREDGDR
ncbi:winged helix-turn-helix domain-containing protein [Streptomyces chartreusis]|uniref:winged helix-turn-helix domain-containing protein n=1 Tax=Streptomyces chartreusis TaxID=1969 RepID=UPI0037103045